METVITSVTQGLTRRGHQVRILLTGPSEDPHWECGLPVHHVASSMQLGSRQFSGDNLLKIQAMLLLSTIDQLEVPDVIVTTAPWVTAVAKVVSAHYKENPPKVMSWVHFSLHAVPGRNWLSQADANIAISNGIQQQLLALPKKVPTYLVYNPVDTSVPLIQRSATLQFLYVGRIFNSQKRLDRLLTALATISGDWGLTIVGDGPDRSTLEELTYTLQIRDKVRWLGWKVDPWAAVKEASALVLPSEYEGFPLVLVEALARGIPVISSDCMTGPREIVISGENGWTFPLPGDAELRRILQSIAKGQISLPSQAACKTSVEKFDQRFFLDSFENAILQCGNM